MNAVLSAYVPPRVFHNSVTILCLFAVTLCTVYVTTYYRRLFIVLQKKLKNKHQRQVLVIIISSWNCLNCTAYPFIQLLSVLFGAY